MCAGGSVRSGGFTVAVRRRFGAVAQPVPVSAGPFPFGPIAPRRTARGARRTADSPRWDLGSRANGPRSACPVSGRSPRSGCGAPRPASGSAPRTPGPPGGHHVDRHDRARARSSKGHVRAGRRGSRHGTRARRPLHRPPRQGHGGPGDGAARRRRRRGGTVRPGGAGGCTRLSRRSRSGSFSGVNPQGAGHRVSTFRRCGHPLPSDLRRTCLRDLRPIRARRR